MVGGESYMRAALPCEKLAYDITVVNGLDLVSANRTSGRKDIHPPAFQKLAVEIQRSDAEVFDEVRLCVGQSQDGDQSGEILFNDAWTRIGFFVRTLVDDQYIFRGKLIDILAGDKDFERLHVCLGNLQRLAYVKDKVTLAVGKVSFRMNKLDDFDDHHHFLLHGEGLIHLLDDLHDLRPVVNKLLRFHIQAAEVLLAIDVMALNELVE